MTLPCGGCWSLPLNFFQPKPLKTAAGPIFWSIRAFNFEAEIIHDTFKMNIRLSRKMPLYLLLQNYSACLHISLEMNREGNLMRFNW